MAGDHHCFLSAENSLARLGERYAASSRRSAGKESGLQPGSAQRPLDLSCTGSGGRGFGQGLRIVRTMRYTCPYTLLIQETARNGHEGFCIEEAGEPSGEGP